MRPEVEALFDLGGRVALVTGGSSGIGRAVAWALAAAGANVVLVARRIEALDRAVAEFKAEGLEASAVTCDLADRAGLTDLIAECGNKFAEPDILVNASGLNVRKPFPDTTDSDWDLTIATNLTAPFALTRAFAPLMAKRNWGRIINIASLQSVRAFANGAPYGATKAALVQLTRSTAEYWSRSGVTCNAIAPGFFPTALTASLFNDPERTEALAQKTMIGRNGELSDLHGTAVFLASNASAYMTGQTLFVDGGFSAA